MLISGTAASVVCHLTESPAFDIWSSSLDCGWRSGVELATVLSSGYDTLFWQFPSWLRNFSQSTSVYSALESLTV